MKLLQWREGPRAPRACVQKTDLRRAILKATCSGDA